MPLTVPMTQLPWSAPNATEEMRNEGRLNLPGETSVKSAEITLRSRKPRKARSWARGTTTIPQTTLATSTSPDVTEDRPTPRSKIEAFEWADRDPNPRSIAKASAPIHATTHDQDTRQSL